MGNFHSYILHAIDEVNKTITCDEKINYSDRKVLIGKNSVLDSLNQINFSVSLEQKLITEENLTLNIFELLNETKTPLTAVNIEQILKEKFGKF